MISNVKNETNSMEADLQNDQSPLSPAMISPMQQQNTQNSGEIQNTQNSGEMQSLMKFIEENNSNQVIENEQNKPAPVKKDPPPKRKRIRSQIRTLPAYLTKLFIKHGKLSFNSLLIEVAKVYRHLRKSSGLKYTASVIKSVKGCLSSDANFVPLGDNYWTYKDDAHNKHLKEIYHEIQIPASSNKDQKGEKLILNELQEDKLNQLLEQTTELYAKKEKSSKPGRSRRSRKRKSENNENDLNILLDENNPNIPECFLSLVPSEFGFSNKKANTIEESSAQGITIEPILSGKKSSKKKNKPDLPEDKTLLAKRKREDDYEKYERVYDVLDKCLITFKKSPFPATLIKHPFDSFKGDETIDDIAKHFDISKLVGLFQCFEFFSPLLRENLIENGNNNQFLVEAEAYFKQILAKISKVDKKIEQISSIKKD